MVVGTDERVILTVDRYPCDTQMSNLRGNHDQQGPVLAGDYNLYGD
jgi:hypothetical protein